MTKNIEAATNMVTNPGTSLRNRRRGDISIPSRGRRESAVRGGCEQFRDYPPPDLTLEDVPGPQSVLL